MIRKRRSSFFIVGMVLILSLAFVTVSAAADAKIRWKGQSCFGINSPLGKHTIVLWKKYVEEMSGGRMELTLHDAGEIVPGSKVYDAVRDGLLDIDIQYRIENPEITAIAIEAM